MKTIAETALAVVALTVGLMSSGCGSHESKPLPTTSMAGSKDATEGDNAKPKGDPAHPLVQIHTSLGEITVKLDAEHAPITVTNFLSYVSSGQYDNTLFHQILTKPAVVIGGGFDGFFKEKPSELPIRNEAHNGLKNARGTIAMARQPDAIDSSTCQFFINCGDNPQLNYRSDTAEAYGYCVFGEVTSGMEVVETMAKSAVHDQGSLTSTPVEPIAIRWIHVVQ